MKRLMLCVVLSLGMTGCQTVMLAKSIINGDYKKGNAEADSVPKIASNAPVGKSNQPVILSAEDSYTLAELYYNSGRDKDLPKAIPLFQYAADNGHKFAQARLGVMYLRGMGIRQDFRRGKEYLLAAAEQGVAIAQSELGDVYAFGKGVPVDLAQAEEWYKLAAEQGDLSAMMGLGHLNYILKSPHQDIEEAKVWYRKAAEFGSVEATFLLAKLYTVGPEDKRNYSFAIQLFDQAHVAAHPDALTEKAELISEGRVDGISKEDAQALFMMAAEHSSRAAYDLGVRYENGDGVKQSDAEAFKWYKHAADQEHGRSAYQLAQMYQKGRGTSINLSLANKYLELAASKGVVAATVKLADNALTGYGMTADPKKAITLYEQAAEKGNPYARLVLSVIYREGVVVPKNLERSVMHYLKADQQSDVAQAKYHVGQLYMYGYGVPVNIDEALYWFKMAADGGAAQAQVLLGDYYLHGRGVPQSNESALGFYKQAADRHSGRGYYNLGLMYLNGLGVAPNDKLAAEWIEKAARKGIIHAQYQIGHMYYYGQGVEQSYPEAYAWLALSAQNLYEGSYELLDEVISTMRPYETAKALALTEEYRKRYVHPHLMTEG